MTAPTPAELDALTTRLDDHDAAMAAAVDRFLELAAGELHDVLAEIVHQDESRRIVAHRLGIPVRRPAADLAAEILKYAMRDLRPYVTFTTEESAARAAEMLTNATPR